MAKKILVSYTGEGYGGGTRTILFMMLSDDERITREGETKWKVVDDQPVFKKQNGKLLVGKTNSGQKVNVIESKGKEYFVFSDWSVKAA